MYAIRSYYALPLVPAVVNAMQNAVAEMGKKESFKGYGPEQGYDFLRNSIKDYYSRKSVELDANEIFVSDGAKSDCGNILDIFSVDNIVLVPDPVYRITSYNVCYTKLLRGNGKGRGLWCSSCYKAFK